MLTLIWIPISKCLPEKKDSSDYSEEVLVSTEFDMVDLDYYDFRHSLWIYHGKQVLAWATKPMPFNRYQ